MTAVGSGSNGRKFAVTVLGMALGTAVQLLAVWRAADVGAYLAFLGVAVVAFCGGNAAATVAWARTEAVTGSTAAKREPARSDDERGEFPAREPLR